MAAGRSERGTASVEHAGLVCLLALLLLAAISAFAAGGGERNARELGESVTRRIRCAAVLSDTCWRDPLTTAYGRAVAGAVRALAPEPSATSAGSGALLPVDFRRCRSTTCAAPGPGSPRLTASNRRTTAFVSVEDTRRATGGGVEITYWLYRPTLGWERVVRSLPAGEVATYESTPLLESDVPALVPLETLPRRNHFRFTKAEEPPWRWQIVG
ncbi:hypothetical protein HJD18_01085 [Thermoleophilia bacterium SCSIO 60948]|nr:hypothetical protein HJD18_01085 [Thermoleophilia bacterium SCSIO 60948]